MLLGIGLENVTRFRDSRSANSRETRHGW